MINNVNYQQQQLQAQQAQAQQVQQQVQEQTQQLNDISQYGDISVFNQDNPYKGDEIQFSDLQDRIEAANKFFAENILHLIKFRNFSLEKHSGNYIKYHKMILFVTIFIF